MKIGRNDPCPCGSGKKYKKCCMMAPSDFVAASDHPYIAEKSNSIHRIMEQYVYQDVVKAVFCLNSWRCNRSALAQVLAMNLGLYNLQHSGNQRIQSYDELRSFYEKLTPFTRITPSEDYIIDDYGEIFVVLHGKRYPVITGTGYLQGYAIMRFAMSLMELTGNSDKMTVLLEYLKCFLESTAAYNEPNQQQLIKYELPSEKYWDCIESMFNMPEFNALVNKAAEVIAPYQYNIDQLHFINHDEFVYPVFNTSLIIDYYKGVWRTIPYEEQHQHIERTLLSILEESSNYAPNEPPRALLHPCIVDTITNKITSANRLLFTARDSNRVLIAIVQNDATDNESIHKTIEIINNLHRNDQLSIVEGFIRDNNPGPYGLHIPGEMKLVFAIVDCHNNGTEMSFSFEEQDQDFSCSAADMLYILGFADGFAEILDFIDYHKNEKAQIITFGGKSTLFFDWKSANRQIVPGGVDCDLLNIGFNDADEYVHDSFRKCFCHMPNHVLFDEPLAWHIEPLQHNFFEVQHRGCKGFGGLTRELCSNTYVFCAHNVTFYSIDDFENQADLTRRVVDELNEQLFIRHGEEVGMLSAVNGKTLQLIYMPWSYAQNHHADSFMNNTTKQFVFCDALVEKNSICIRYAVSSAILQAIETAKDRSVENIYFLELLQPIVKYCPDEFALLKDRLKAEETLLRTVGVFSTKQSYYYSSLSLSTAVPDYCFVNVRKEIAKICYDAGVLPKEYHGKEATTVIRTLQKTIVSAFESHIRKLGQFQLHCMALSYYAVQQYGMIIHMTRYHSFSDLAPEIQVDFENRTRNERQTCRRNVETAHYLMETNLVVEHDPDARDCTESDLQYLIAYADWLVVLQEAADLCHSTDKDIFIQIDDMYRVDTIMNDEDRTAMDAWVERKYNTQDYQIDGGEVDAEFMKKTSIAFHEDTGIELQHLLDLLSYMQLGLIQDTQVSEQQPNVFSIKKQDIISSYIQQFDENPPTSEKVEKLIDFITINEQLIKTVNGTSHDLLPIWEREKRDNRIEVKPIILRNDCCIFTPVSLHTLESMWYSGITNWFLPYEIGLQKTKNVIVAWKKHYEDKMVHDIVQLFIDAGFSLALPDVEFIKRFPKQGYPPELGDYDTIAYCANRHELWIIESKVLQKVASIHEDQNQQKTFFFKHKDDEKFQRRIDYAITNLPKILSSFHIDDADCKLVYYMVTNKLFGSRYKDVQFEIITFFELKKLLENNP